MKVLINENGYLESPYIKDANIEIEVDDEAYALISECTIDHNWRYLNGEWIKECLYEEEYFRTLRESECFSIIDRSKLWYDSLTTEQYQEIQEWYRKWLDVTKTKVIPTKPSWLN